MDEAGKAGKAVGNAVAGGAGAVAASASSAAASVASGANEAAQGIGELGAEAGADMMQAGVAAGAAGSAAFGAAAGAAENAFGDVKELYTGDLMKARDDILRMSGLLTEGCTKVLPLLRIEIFRDFSQIVSVVFGSSYTKEVIGWVKAAKDWIGNVCSLIAINFYSLFKNETAILIGVILAITLAVVTIGLFIWMVNFSGVSKMKMDHVRSGHENISFADQVAANKRTIFLVNLTIIIATSLYLPLTQTAFEVLFCDDRSFFLKYFMGYAIESSAYTTNIKGYFETVPPQYSTTKVMCANGWMIAGAVFTLLVFSVAVPIFLYKEINKHMPTGSPLDPEWTNDIDGIRVKFDNRVYNELVETDKSQVINPFRDLYRGYEKEHSSWKIFVMVYKLSLTLAITIAVTEDASPMFIAIISFVFMLIMFAYTYVSRPFIEPLNDLMDEAGRFTAIIASIGGIVNAATNKDSNVAQAVGFLVFFSGIINGVFMVSIMFSGVQFFRNFVKSAAGIFTFYDSCSNLGDLSPLYVISMWQTRREIKHRVWQSFWNGVITQKCGEETAQRLSELQQDAVDYGIKYIDDHWLCLKDKQIMANRLYCQDHLEGVDLYWEGITRDGHNDSVTKFGKMYVKRYPFHMVMVFDDADDESFIQGPKNVAAFIAKQQEPAIQAKVLKRRTLRVISKSEKTIEWPFSRNETRHVPDGTESYTDSKGKRRTRTAYSTIKIVIAYTRCAVRVGANTEYDHADGFNFSAEYNDGHGSARKPRTGQMHVETTAHASMPMEHIGFIDNTSFETEPLYDAFVRSAMTEINLVEGMQTYLADEESYRKGIQTKFEGKRNILANSFWYFVYNNAAIKRPDLERYLSQTETNQYLKLMPDADKDGFDYLFKRMELVNSSERSRLWFVFWEDFYLQNKDLAIIKANDILFNPNNSSAFCYKNIPDRQECERLLDNVGLMHKPFTKNLCGFAILPIDVLFCSKKHIKPKVLDLLYERLDHPEKFPLKEYNANRSSFMNIIFGKTSSERADKESAPMAELDSSREDRNPSSSIVSDNLEVITKEILEWQKLSKEQQTLKWNAMSIEEKNRMTKNFKLAQQQQVANSGHASVAPESQTDLQVIRKEISEWQKLSKEQQTLKWNAMSLEEKNRMTSNFNKAKELTEQH